MARKTYYEILKVAPDASRREIKKAFRLRAAECHPDKVMHLEVELRERAERKMTLINEAYKVLSDETSRTEYDEYLGVVRAKYLPIGGQGRLAQRPGALHIAGRKQGTDRTISGL